MYVELTAKDLQDCFVKAISSIVENTDETITGVVKVCYDDLGITFTDCDNNCIIEHIISHSTAASFSGSDGYDSAKLEDFYSTAAKENVELCYYNCHHLDKTEL